MKKRYQIDKQRAVQKFRQLASRDDQPIQLVIPLKEVVELIQRGLMKITDYLNSYCLYFQSFNTMSSLPVEIRLLLLD